MKKLIYTCLFGGVDDLKEPLKTQSDWSYIVITDDPNLKSPVWDTIVVPPGDPKKLSRYYKIKNHFPDYDLSVYVDCTFQIKKQPLDRFALSKTEGIWLNSHPQRQCLYEEAEIVKSKGLDDPNLVDEQVSRYRKEGYPEQNGLYRCGILVRNPKDDKITEMCDLWWEEVDKYSWRDQISFPYSCWKTGVTPNPILHGITQIYFKQSLHLNHPSQDWVFIPSDTLLPEPAYEKYNQTIDRYDTAHTIVLTTGILTPRWLLNYISPKVGIPRFLELVRILNGITVRA